MANDANERRRDELKLIFDHFKHFTTLAAVLALFLLTFGEQAGVVRQAGFFGVALGVATLGMSMFYGVAGMLVVLLVFSIRRPDPRLDIWVPVLAFFAPVALLLALFSFAYDALRASGSNVLLALVFFVIFVGSVAALAELLVRLRRRDERRRRQQSAPSRPPRS